MSEINQTSQLIAIAKAVTDSLAEYDAELAFAPEISLAELSARRVVVVPLSQKYEPVSRSEQDATYQIQIGVMCRAKEENVPELLALAERIALPFQLRTFCDATCTKVEFNPIYAAEYLRGKSLFYSVATLTFEQEVES